MIDLRANWMVAKAVAAGIDPAKPISELANQLGTADESDIIHPRTPAALLLFMPLAAVPIDSLVSVGRFLVIAEAMVAAWLLARLLEVAPVRLLVLVPAFLITIGPLNTVILGSHEMLLLVLFAGTALMMRRSDSLAAGVLVGVAAALKLWPLFLCVVLWVTGRRKAAAGGALTLTVLGGVGLALPNVTLAGSLQALIGAGQFLGHHRNGSLPSVLTMVGVPPSWSLGVAAIGGAGFLLWARTRDAEEALLTGIPVAIFLAPIAWPSYLTLLALPAIRLSRPWQIAAGIISMGWLITPTPWSIVAGLLTVVIVALVLRPETGRMQRVLPVASGRFVVESAR